LIMISLPGRGREPHEASGRQPKHWRAHTRRSPVFETVASRLRKQASAFSC
jgi:hypothetical protein